MMPVIRPKALHIPLTKHTPTLQYLTKIHLPPRALPLRPVLPRRRRRLRPLLLPSVPMLQQQHLLPRPRQHRHLGRTRARPSLPPVRRRLQPRAKRRRFTLPLLVRALAEGVSGMAGLGRTEIALPSQLASAFGFRRKFAVCLASNDSNGVVFFGDGPYVFLPNIDASRSLTFTPLFINPVSTASAFARGEPSSEYFIGVKSTKRLVRHGTLRGWVPWRRSKRVFSTRLGWAVPTVELVLQNESVVWRVLGANSVVDVSDEVICLGFVNGGKRPRSSMVIGGYQLENSLLQFDLASSRLGFSSLLFGRQTTCGNFNFTSTV
ncbi:Basic 7S globulin 2 [Spatholobus suberectus]|nr:Basic 7S globulin 2 [Spatholobus suberectus]